MQSATIETLRHDRGSERRTFDDFLATLRSAIGQEYVVTSGSDYELRAKDPAINARRPRAFVYPSCKEEVQLVVREAAKAGIKLWTHSTGKNWGYLNTTTDADSVVMLLHRMNRIVHVDENLGYAIIEPGVTYEALNRHLKEKHYRLWTDSPGGPPTGSVIGNALDRGVGVTKYGDHYAHLCGYEVVLADGTIVHTGAARSDGEKGAAHLYKWGVGPFVEGLFSQSNFGVVTQAGIWLMREPEEYTLFNMRIDDDAALVACMNTVRELMLEGVIPEIGRFSNDTAMLTLLTQAIDEGLGPDQTVSRETLSRLKAKYHVPGWTGSFGIYGSKPVVRAATSVAKRRLRKGGCSHVNALSKRRAYALRRAIEVITPIQQKSVVKVIDRTARTFLGTSLACLKLFPGLIDLHEGKPVETVVRRGYFRHKSPRPEKNIHVGRDDLGILWSVPVLPFDGAEVVAFSQKCRALFERYGFDFYMTTMVFSARSVCPLMVILYDRLDEISCKRAERLYKEILDLSHHLGYQHFRAGVNGWDNLYQSNPNLKELHQKLKRALDPDGVLAPGRYGIE